MCRSLFALLALLIALPSVGATTITEPFTGSNGALPGAWTVHQGAADLNTNAMRIQTGSFGNVFATHSTGLAGTYQYVKIVMTGSPSLAFPYAICHFNTSGTRFYGIQSDPANGNVDWYSFASTSASEDLVATGGNFSLSFTSLGVTCTGTGTGTIIRAWRNPSANAPTTAALWDGAGPGISYTDDPGANAADAGTSVGAGGVQNTANTIFITDFFAGDDASAGGGAPLLLRRRQD